jgi:uncharacterized protein YjbI with pentapeptide repeats
MSYARARARVLGVVISLSLATAAAMVVAAPAQAAGCPTVDPSTGAVTPAPTPGVQWSGCDLTGADLAGFNMSNGNLSSAILKKANLTGSTLNVTDLGSADLTNANLTNAKLMQAILSGTTMTGATLTGVSSGLISAGPQPTLPTDWSLIGGYLVGPGANLRFAGLTFDDLTNADLRNANLTDAKLAHSTLTGANLAGAMLTGVSSGSIVGTPTSLPTNWILAAGYLIGPGANLYLAALQNLNLSGLDLRSIILNSADLSDANFSDTNLTDAILTGVNLAGTNLTGATLTGEQSGQVTGAAASLPTGWSTVGGFLIGPGAELHDANLATFTLNGADLYGADLNGADLVQASLTGANLSHTDMAGASVGNADLAGARLHKANLDSAVLDGANLSSTLLTSANLTFASLSDATLTNANLTGATLTGASAVAIKGSPAAMPTDWSVRGGYLIGPGTGTALNGVYLGRLNLAGVDFSGLDLLGTVFRHSNLTGANLTKTNLSGADFSYANLTKADLAGATVSSTVFAGTIWKDTTCPDGSNSNTHRKGQCFPPPRSSGFTAHQLPTPFGGSRPNSLAPLTISCASASQCYGGGYYFGPSVGHAPAWFYWTGGRWFSATAPVPRGGETGPNSNSAMTSVSCPSLKVCFAAGHYRDRAGGQGMLLRWTGTHWTAAKAPLPANATSNPDATVAGISCRSATMCMAVGQYSDTDGNQDGLLLRWSAGRWSATAAPVPTASLDAVSCPSAKVCYAGGWQYVGSTQPQPLILRWSGGQWVAVKVSLPSGAAADPLANIAGISCPSIHQCVAAGYYTDSHGNQQGVLLIFSGHTWAAVKAPLPAGVGSNPGTSLNAVSCPATSDCTVGGGYMNTARQTVGLLLFWSGKTWTAVQAPIGAFTLHGISCPTVTRCVAVSYGSLHPLALIGP